MAKEVGTSELLDTWGTDGAIVEPTELKKGVGWELQEQPPHEYANWLINTAQQAINHVLQNGVPQWNATTTYVAGNIVNIAGTLYQAKTTNTNSTPPNVNWQAIAPYPPQHSIEQKDGKLQLKNDLATPGNNKFYGTDGAGNRGWFTQITNGFETGDYRWRATRGSLAGYVRANGGSIGNASSGATERANADTEALFTLLWAEVDYAVSGGRGASAASDYAANKRLTLPDARNAVPAFIDGMGLAETDRLTNAMAGLDGKKLGAFGGSQGVALTVPQLAAHFHYVSNLDTTGGTSIAEDTYIRERPSQGGENSYALIGNDTEAHVGRTSTTGEGEEHPNVQPTFIAGTLYIKL